MPISNAYAPLRRVGLYHQPDIRRKMMCRRTQKKRRLAMRRAGKRK